MQSDRDWRFDCVQIRSTNVHIRRCELQLAAYFQLYVGKLNIAHNVILGYPLIYPFQEFANVSLEMY